MTKNTGPRRKPLGRSRTPQEIADDVEVAVEDGVRVAHVRTPGGRIVKIDAADFERLLDAGWSPALRLACPGRAAVYVVARKLKARPNKAGRPPKGSDGFGRSARPPRAKTSDAIVARLVTGAAEDEAVRYLNGRYDLRSRSLAVVKSPAMAARAAARRETGVTKAAKVASKKATPEALGLAPRNDRPRIGAALECAQARPSEPRRAFAASIPHSRFDEYGFPLD